MHRDPLERAHGNYISDCVSEDRQTHRIHRQLELLELRSARVSRMGTQAPIRPELVEGIRSDLTGFEEPFDRLRADGVLRAPFVRQPSKNPILTPASKITSLSWSLRACSPMPLPLTEG